MAARERWLAWNPGEYVTRVAVARWHAAGERWERAERLLADESEETDAYVIVVSEETGAISVVMGGELNRGLDAPRLRVALRDALTRGGGDDATEEASAPTPEREPQPAQGPVGSR